MAEIKIVNVRNLIPNDPRVVYCGRECYGWRRSPLGNPFMVKAYGSRADVIARYKVWLEDEYARGGEVRAEIDRLVILYKTVQIIYLGCWCWPHPCHCSVIKEKVMRLAGDV